ncbi:MAG TPA: GNAT family N-acetyltransferase [Pseudomonadales bacterium]|nr:GNAT family N-acetyltransferase [Pseudomonadales bacterium]
MAIRKPGARKVRSDAKIHIRRAVPEDLDDLVEMLHQLDAHVSGAPREALQLTASGEQALRDRLARLIAIPDGCIVVAEPSRGPLVAMASCGVWHENGVWLTPERLENHTAVVDDVWVDPAWRRRGLVRRMLRVLTDFAAERGAEDVVLEYSLANPEAAQAWARLGFTPTGVRAATRLDALQQNLRDAPGRGDADNQGENNGR